MSDKATTKAVIVKMLRENTGASFLDSGGTPKFDENGCYLGSTGGYGRAYERNQCTHFDLQPHLAYRFSTWGNGSWELESSRSVYQLLQSNFEFAEDWQQIFDDFCENIDRGKSWLQCMQEFGDWLGSIYEEVGFGPYGESPHAWDGICNTYNVENNLSQDLQFMELSIPEEGTNLTIIQIHNGCDARGGYTAPKVFRENGMCELPLWDTGRLWVHCTANENHQWDSDNGGYSFYWSGWNDVLDESDQPTLPNLLDDLQKVELAKIRMGVVQNLDKYELYDPEYGAIGMDSDGEPIYAPEDEDWEDNPSWRKGYMFIDEDGNGYCPICGGKLEVY